MEYYWHPCMFRDSRTVQDSPNIFLFRASDGWFSSVDPSLQLSCHQCKFILVL